MPQPATCYPSRTIINRNDKGVVEQVLFHEPHVGMISEIRVWNYEGAVKFMITAKNNNDAAQLDRELSTLAKVENPLVSNYAVTPDGLNITFDFNMDNGANHFRLADVMKKILGRPTHLPLPAAFLPGFFEIQQSLEWRER